MSNILVNTQQLRNNITQQNLTLSADAVTQLFNATLNVTEVRIETTRQAEWFAGAWVSSPFGNVHDLPFPVTKELVSKKS